MEKYELIYKLNNFENESKILGINNIFLNYMEEFFKTEILIKQGEVYVLKDAVDALNIAKFIDVLETLFNHNIELTQSDFVSLIKNIDFDKASDIVDLYLEKKIIYSAPSGKVVYPRTLNQKLYIKALEENDIVFALGPAGTGKTYLAVLYALSRLKKNFVKKIILVRPIVEAGEKLGFLPGDFKDKIDPYLIPIYDGLYDALGKETVDKMIEKGTIEVAPLAYMRGRTLENAVIILDEAQNTTLSQMKMFLTRLGFHSKMIITGDVTQIDLPNKNISGLIEAVKILEDVDGIKMIHFNRSDVMRHPLVYKIIERYESERWL